MFIKSFREILRQTVRQRMKKDGLNSLQYELVDAKEKELYTWLLVKPPPPPASIYGTTPTPWLLLDVRCGTQQSWVNISSRWSFHVSHSFGKLENLIVHLNMWWRVEWVVYTYTQINWLSIPRSLVCPFDPVVVSLCVWGIYEILFQRRWVIFSRIDGYLFLDYFVQVLFGIPSFLCQSHSSLSLEIVYGGVSSIVLILIIYFIYTLISIYNLLKIILFVLYSLKLISLV